LLLLQDEADRARLQRDLVDIVRVKCESPLLAVTLNATNAEGKEEVKRREKQRDQNDTDTNAM
jgi:hypothetical protein